MKKYIYGRYEPATVPQIEQNDFHTISIFLGAYFEYCRSPQYKDFKSFVLEHHLSYEDIKIERCWHFINIAQIYVRDCLAKDTVSKPFYISRRQIKKLGYSGLGSVRMYPLSGKIIQDVIFNYIFEEKHLEPVKELYLDYLYHEWIKENPSLSFSTQNGGISAVKNSAYTFMGFQIDLLIEQKQNKFIEAHRKSPKFTMIQQEVNRRGELNAWQ